MSNDRDSQSCTCTTCKHYVEASEFCWANPSNNTRAVKETGEACPEWEMNDE